MMGKVRRYEGAQFNKLEKNAFSFIFNKKESMLLKEYVINKPIAYTRKFFI